MALAKKLTALLLALVFVFAAGAVSMRGVYAEGIDSDYDGIPDEYDVDAHDNVFTGRMKSSHENNTTTVSFTVDFRNFFEDNTVYQPALAGFSSIGSALAYYNTESNESFPTWVRFDDSQTWSGGIATQVQGPELMPIFGFKDIVNYTLNHYGDDDICEMTIGHRAYTYNGETKIIIAIWVRGTEPKSAEEWSSNFNVGDLVRFFDAYDSEAGKTPRQSNDDWTRKTNHRGFDVCATRLLKYLKTYYLDEYVQPELDENPGASRAFWLTGHSRGAAVANLMASYLIDEGEEIFAYTFAAPFNTANTEASAEKYDCIFNLVNANDFVPMLPMPEWGFTRFGKTAVVDASQWATEIKNATGATYSGNYISSSEMNTLLNKFICITGENSDRNNPGKILGWREVYVFHCGHDHAGETNGNYQSTTVCPWGLFGPYETDYYNKYPIRLQKYSYWNGGICETPAYCMQVLVELLAKVGAGETISGASAYITSNKLADKFDFDKWSLVSYATKLTEPHFMDTYSVIQAQINAAGNPGARFHTLRYYTAENADGGRPIHTHTYTYVPYEGQAPTCENEGFGYRYCLCSNVNADYYDDYQKNVVIPALGHDWNEPEYSWSEGYLTCTASRVCARNASHTEEETVDANFELITEATYEAPGLGRWTAEFTNEGFETQTVDVEIPQLEAPEIFYTVTFKDWDGTVLSTQVVAEGAAAEAPANPSREGYTFVGWDTDFGNITANTVVNAQYVINNYLLMIYYEYENGTAARSPYMQLYNYGASYSVVSPVIEGYTASIAVVEGVMGAADVEVTVVYTENTAPAGILGDVNCDGIVDFSDASALAAYLMGGSTPSAQGLINADANQDGSVTIADVTAIYAIIFG